MDECLVPLDGEKMMIVDNELHACLVRPLADGVHLVAVLDTCHSGSLLDLPHYRCNRVFVPWVFRGRRNSEDKRQGVVRRGAHMASAGAPPAAAPERPRGYTLVHSPPRAATRAFAKVRRHMTLPSPNPLTTLLRFLPEKEPCASPVARFPCDGWCRTHRAQDADPDCIKADVISLASCKDSQMAWEDERAGVRISMTSALVELLHANPNRSLRDVLMSVSHATYSMALERHRQGRVNKHQRKAYVETTTKRLATLKRNPSTRSLLLPDPAPAPIALSPTFPAPRGKRPVLARRVMHHIRWLRQMLVDVGKGGGNDMDDFQNPELASPQPLDMKRMWRM
ncbi:hypothetical protein DFH09DRAFT_1371484 [Mycena vulgaris]|nr:hypothetical protein DFH09DRAFT_1371484 [Mycena vulgaris]